MFAAYRSDVEFTRLTTPVQISDEMGVGIDQLNFSQDEVAEYATKWFDGIACFKGSPSMMKSFCAELEWLTGATLVYVCLRFAGSTESMLPVKEVQVFFCRLRNGSLCCKANVWLSLAMKCYLIV